VCDYPHRELDEIPEDKIGNESIGDSTAFGYNLTVSAGYRCQPQVD
jgi:hypothetical protein